MLIIFFDHFLITDAYNLKYPLILLVSEDSWLAGPIQTLCKLWYYWLCTQPKFNLKHVEIYRKLLNNTRGTGIFPSFIWNKFFTPSKKRYVHCNRLFSLLLYFLGFFTFFSYSCAIGSSSLSFGSSFVSLFTIFFLYLYLYLFLFGV